MSVARTVLVDGLPYRYDTGLEAAASIPAHIERLARSATVGEINYEGTRILVSSDGVAIFEMPKQLEEA